MIRDVGKVDLRTVCKEAKKMNNLSALATLIKWANKNRICVDLYTTIEKQGSIRELVYTRQWVADLRPFDTEIITGNQAQTIDEACGSLIEICQQQGIAIPKVGDPETIIPHHQEVAILIANLYNILPKLEKDDQSLLFQYWVSVESADEDFWIGQIYLDSKWSGYIEAEVDGATLFEVCTKLWEECVKKLER